MMNELLFEDLTIKILDEEDVRKEADQELVIKSKEYDKDSLEWADVKNTYEKLLNEPMPYKLFRLNELKNHDLINVGVEITEEAYCDRLGQLPPVEFTKGVVKGWIVNEPITYGVYEHIFFFKGKYYSVIAKGGLKK